MTDHQDLELVEPQKVHLPLWKEDDLSERDEFVGYPISLKRMILYCLASGFIFGMGPIFIFIWFYKHIRPFIKAGSKGSLSTVFLALVAPFSFFKLYAVYSERAENRCEKFGSRKYDAPIVYISLSVSLLLFMPSLAVRLGIHFPWAFLLAPLITLLPLLYFQHRVNGVNKRLLPGKQFAPPLTKLQWLLISLGTLWSMAMIATLFYS